MVEIFAEISTLLIYGLAKTSHMIQYTIQTSLAEFKLSGEIIGLCGTFILYLHPYYQRLWTWLWSGIWSCRIKESPFKSLTSLKAPLFKHSVNCISSCARNYKWLKLMLLSKACKQDQDQNLHFELIFIVEILECAAMQVWKFLV